MARAFAVFGPIRFAALTVAVAVTLSGCNIRLLKRKPPVEPPAAEECDPAAGICIEVLTPDADTIRPAPRPVGHEVAARPAVGPAGEGFVEGVSADDIDKTSAKDKEKARQSDATAGEKELGRTVASLGAVGEQGFWLRTPLVLKATEGRVVWADNGNSANVTLLPKAGEVGAGSQISLAAMRALGIPLTALPELIVYAR